MNRVEFITCLVVFEDLLHVVYVVHKALYSTSCTLADATKVTSNLRAHVLSKKRRRCMERCLVHSKDVNFHN